MLERNIALSNMLEDKDAELAALRKQLALCRKVCEAQTDEIIRLREALEPFAKPGHPGDHADNYECVFWFRDVRRAAKALEGE